MNDKNNGQYCPVCDVWCELPEDQEDGSYITCENGHVLLVEWAEGDYEDYHLKHQKDRFDVKLPDGRIAHCWEAQAQEYSNCKFSAGLVDGIPPDNLYLRIERHKEEPTFFFFRPDEVSAILFSLSGALWSSQIFELDNGTAYGI